MKHALLCLFPLLLSAVHLPAQQKPQVHLISVEKDVKIEALDWGGTGRPLLFIAGAGNDAHIFDTFAPKFVPRFHVYGVTRRGFGASSHPAYITSNYTAERLGSDVLAVMSALKIDHPVLIGHSLAGEEMSWIGNHHPEAVAGLVYLEAGYSFALYSPALGDKVLDALTLRQELDTFLAAHTPPGPSMAQLQADTARFENDLAKFRRQIALLPPCPHCDTMPPTYAPITTGDEKFLTVHGPVLAIFADPHDPGPIFANDAKGRAAYVANDEVETTQIVEAFQSAVPQAHVVRIANASHYIFISNEAQVITEINNFLGSLKQ
jgi:non-heme chloroperoxidase